MHAKIRDRRFPYLFPPSPSTPRRLPEEFGSPAFQERDHRSRHLLHSAVADRDRENVSAHQHFLVERNVVRTLRLQPTSEK